jgi:undecaprenyl-diphosphatase
MTETNSKGRSKNNTENTNSKGKAREQGSSDTFDITNLDAWRCLALTEVRHLRELKELNRLFAVPVPAVLAGGLGTSLASTIAITKIADGVLSRQTRGFDRKLSKMAQRARHSDKKPLDLIMSLLSAAGEPWTLYPVSAVVALKWLSEERPTDAASLALGLVGSAGINEVLKRTVKRPRPFFKLPFPRSGASGSSFPSNHATMTLATYGTMAFLLARKRREIDEGKDNSSAKGGGSEEAAGPSGGNKTDWQAAARTWAPVLLCCALIGWSRVYQGVHNPSDVLGGWLAGGILLIACSTAIGVMPSASS